MKQTPVKNDIYSHSTAHFFVYLPLVHTCDITTSVRHEHDKQNRKQFLFLCLSHKTCYLYAYRTSVNRPFKNKHKKNCRVNRLEISTRDRFVCATRCPTGGNFRGDINISNMVRNYSFLKISVVREVDQRCHSS